MLAQCLRRWPSIEAVLSQHPLLDEALSVMSVHYKGPLKSFEIRVGHSPGSGLPSVAILP